MHKQVTKRLLKNPRFTVVILIIQDESLFLLLFSKSPKCVCDSEVIQVTHKKLDKRNKLKGTNKKILESLDFANCFLKNNSIVKWN